MGVKPWCWKQMPSAALAIATHPDRHMGTTKASAPEINKPGNMGWAHTAVTKLQSCQILPSSSKSIQGGSQRLTEADECRPQRYSAHPGARVGITDVKRLECTFCHNSLCTLYNAPLSCKHILTPFPGGEQANHLASPVNLSSSLTQMMHWGHWASPRPAICSSQPGWLTCPTWESQHVFWAELYFCFSNGQGWQSSLLSNGCDVRNKICTHDDNSMSA